MLSLIIFALAPLASATGLNHDYNTTAVKRADVGSTEVNGVKPQCCGKVDGDYLRWEKKLQEFRDIICNQRDQADKLEGFSKLSFGSDSKINDGTEASVSKKGYAMIDVVDRGRTAKEGRVHYGIYAQDTAEQYADCSAAIDAIIQDCVVNGAYSGGTWGKITNKEEEGDTWSEGQIYGVFAPPPSDKKFKWKPDRRSIEEVTEVDDDDDDEDWDVSQYDVRQFSTDTLNGKIMDIDFPSGLYKIDGKVWNITVEDDILNKSKRQKRGLETRTTPWWDESEIHRRDAVTPWWDGAPNTKRDAVTPWWDESTHTKRDGMADGRDQTGFNPEVNLGEILMKSIQQRESARNHRRLAKRHHAVHNHIRRGLNNGDPNAKSHYNDVFNNTCAFSRESVDKQKDEYIATSYGTWNQKPRLRGVFEGPNTKVTLTNGQTTKVTNSIEVSSGVNIGIISASASYGYEMTKEVEDRTEIEVDWDFGACHIVTSWVKMGWQRGFIVEWGRGKKGGRGLYLKTVHTDGPLKNQGDSYNTWLGCCARINEGWKSHAICQDARVTDANREYFGVCNVYIRNPRDGSDVEACKSGRIDNPMTQEEFDEREREKEQLQSWEDTYALKKENAQRKADGLPLNPGPRPETCPPPSSVAAETDVEKRGFSFSNTTKTETETTEDMTAEVGTTEEKPECTKWNKEYATYTASKEEETVDEEPTTKVKGTKGAKGAKGVKGASSKVASDAEEDDTLEESTTEATADDETEDTTTDELAADEVDTTAAKSVADDDTTVEADDEAVEEDDSALVSRGLGYDNEDDEEDEGEDEGDDEDGDDEDDDDEDDDDDGDEDQEDDEEDDEDENPSRTEL